MYSRAVNKTGLAMRLIDGKSIQRCFTQEEISDLRRVDDWVGCDRCTKWRMFPPDCNVDENALPEKVGHFE